MQPLLVIDNYDSFVHNLARYFRLLGCETIVLRSDQTSLLEIDRIAPAALILSPGPKGPDEAGISLEVVKTFSGRIPILGVCLGHQTIGQAFGGRIVREQPVHGRCSPIIHQGIGIFRDLPSPLKVGRYHSLVIACDSLPEELEVTARTLEGTIMAVQHRTHRTAGVQFHPESILSEYGLEMLRNFLSFASLPVSLESAPGPAKLDG